MSRSAALSHMTPSPRTMRLPVWVFRALSVAGPLSAAQLAELRVFADPANDPAPPPSEALQWWSEQRTWEA